MLAACGSDGGGAATQPVSPSIASQPRSLSVRTGQTATFSVSATGTGPLTYQWYWNGMRIPTDPTSSSITLPAAVASDDQTNLTVSVSNNYGSVISTPAMLSVMASPRRAAAWDLRFKDIGAFPVPCTGDVFTNILPRLATWYSNEFGTPFIIDAKDDASWMYSTFGLPVGAPGRITRYQAGSLDELSSDISTLSADATVLITSLSVVAGQNGYAMESVKTALPDAYTPSARGAVLPGDLQAVATNEGLAGRVITAVSLGGGQAYYISYGKRGDTSVYDSKVVIATSDTVATAAMDLSIEGYFITAVGGNTTEGIILVGTKVQGDTTPRPIQVTPSYTLAGRGFTPVATISESGANYYVTIYQQ
ncbi:immunoglobulin domain-containing protein [Geomonas sp. Red32]|nr:immunoglobulin domain-containing protein [Geomonas sp. Red32]MCM0080578.1 immunoglobulin domain-containing protein [Geomonas sp. Red32]